MAITVTISFIGHSLLDQRLAAQLAGPTICAIGRLAKDGNGRSYHDGTDSDRQSVLDRYRLAIDQGGDPGRGKLVFEKQCATCHAIADLGEPIGPSLTSMASRGVDNVLRNILDPSQDLDSRYVEYHIVTREGAVIRGMIVADTTTALTLINAEGIRSTISRSQIDSLQATAKSMMPDRFDQLINEDAMADLFAFLQQMGAVHVDPHATQASPETNRATESGMINHEFRTR